MKWLTRFGELLLTLTALTFLFIFGQYLFSRSLYGFLLWVVVILLFGIALFHLWFRRTDKRQEKLSLMALWEGIALVIASIATYYLHELSFVSPVLASGIIGLIGGICFKKQAKAIFAGSFVGMASLAVYSLIPLIFASIGAAFLYVLAIHGMKGVGGKLGTIAFFGSIMVWGLFDISFSPVNLIGFNLFPWFGFVGIIAAISVRVLTKIKGIDVVIGSSLVGVVLGIIFGLIPFGISPYLAICGYGASFVGMSDEKQMPSLLWLGFGGLIFAIIYHSAFPLFNGAGGKLGMMALISTLVTLGIKLIMIKTINIYRINHKKNPSV
jgi:hypothetical protein